MRAATLLPALLLAACTGAAPPPTDDAAGAGAPADAYTGTQLADHLDREMKELGRKMIDLARAMPDESFAWRPMEGVRSVGEVYAHVAADNFFVPALLGRPVEGTGVTADAATVGAYEAARGTPAEIRTALEASFAAMDDAYAATRLELGREVMLRETTLTTGDLWVRAITHLHEHLGQAIAYARSHEVVPPWSAGG